MDLEEGEQPEMPDFDFEAEIALDGEEFIRPKHSKFLRHMRGL